MKAKRTLLIYIASCPICGKEFISLSDKQLITNVKQHIAFVHKTQPPSEISYAVYTLERE